MADRCPLRAASGLEVERGGMGRRFIATLELGTLVVLAALTLGCAPDESQRGRVVPVTTESEGARKAYLKGRDLQEKLRATDARQYFEKAVSLDPECAIAHLGLATTSPTAPEFFASLAEAVRLADHGSAGERLMILAFEAGVNLEIDRQRELLQQLVDAYPDDARALGILGNFYYARREWDAAIATYRRATEIDPDYSQPYNQLGYALRFQEDWKGAEKAFKKYVELIPDEPNPYDSYGELLMKVGRFEDSIAAYSKALEINPNFVPSYIGIGNNNVFLGRYGAAHDALTTLRFIARTDAERRQACTWTAVACLHQGDLACALEQLVERYEIAEAAADRPSMTADLNLRGMILLESGRVDEAEKVFEQAVVTMSEDDATQDIRDAVLRNNLYARSRVALARGEMETATELAEAYGEWVAAARVPGEIRQWHELNGRLALAQGNPKTAAAEFRQADSQNPQTLFLLAQALERLDDTEEARAVFARSAHFNGLSLPYAFVRNAALKALDRLAH
jgi:tetratricopeptide (TPR) repeat protein